MPGVLTDAEILEFRGLVEELAMPDTFALIRDTDVPDGEGGMTTAETTVASGDCRLRTIGTPGVGSVVERTFAERLGWTATYAIDFPVETPITASDRVVINGSRTMEVGGVIDTGTWAMVLTAIVRELGS